MFASMVLATELASRLALRPASALRADPSSVLPVPSRWRSLFPAGGIRQGSTVSVLASLALVTSFMSAVTQAGLWCAVVGVPMLSAAAASRAGVDLSRCVFVVVGGDIARGVAPLIEMDVVVIGEPARLSAVATRQLTARARQSGTVLLGVGAWASADIRLQVLACRWSGASSGFGQLTSRWLRVRADGRRMPAPRHVEVEWALDG